MIAKFKNQEEWHFIDGVKRFTKKHLYVQDLLAQYNADCELRKRLEPISDLPEDIRDINRIFTIATDEFLDCGMDVHCESLMTVGCVQCSGTQISVVVLYLENTKEYDAVCLVTDQTVYLLNNDGKTIERVN